MGKGGKTDIPETAQEKELAKIATEQWARYEDVFKPLENDWIAKITADPTAEKATARGLAAAGVQTQADAAQKEKDAAVLASGGNLGSGAFKEGVSTGDVMGKTLSRANLGVNERKTGQLMGAVAMGRGQAADAQAGLTDVANQATRDAINSTTSKYLSRRDTGEMVGTGAGMLTREFLPEEGK